MWQRSFFANILSIFMEQLPNNIRRLLGLHAMSAHSASEIIGLSAQALSELQSGKRNPSLRTVQRLAQFFELPMDRLLEASFEELLATELADPTRFERVEAKKQDAKG